MWNQEFFRKLAEVSQQCIPATCTCVTVQSISARDPALGLTGDKCSYEAC